MSVWVLIYHDSISFRWRGCWLLISWSTVDDGKPKAPFQYLLQRDVGEGTTPFHRLLKLLLIRNLLRWVLSKEAPSTMFWVFGITRSGIEPRLPRPLANILSIPSSMRIHCQRLNPEIIWEKKFILAYVRWVSITFLRINYLLKGVAVNVLYSDKVVSEFEFKSWYYVHLRTNTIEKIEKIRILPAKS